MSARDTITHEVMRDFLEKMFDEKVETLCVSQFSIRYDKKERQLKNAQFLKSYRNDVVSKRVYDKNLSRTMTFPFGFTDTKFQV